MSTITAEVVGDHVIVTREHGHDTRKLVLSWAEVQLAAEVLVKHLDSTRPPVVVLPEAP